MIDLHQLPKLPTLQDRLRGLSRLLPEPAKRLGKLWGRRSLFIQ
jgi:hypothetical protein